MNKLITTLLLIFSLSLQAQQNEIKIDVLGFTFDEANISFERMVKKKLGIEVGVGYVFAPEILFSFNQNPMLPILKESTRFKKTAFSFLAAAKYYKILKPRGNRIFLGTFLEYRTKPKVETAYFEAYEFYFGKPDKYPPRERFLVGGLVGFKLFLFKKRILIEPMYGLGFDLIQSDFEVGGFGFTLDGFLKLNLGYRFGGKNKK